MALCIVTGIIYLPNGQPAASRRVSFDRIYQQVTSEPPQGAVVPERIDVETDETGNISVDLLTGNYAVFISDPPDVVGGRVRFHQGNVAVPDEPTATFADILDGYIPPQRPAWFTDDLKGPQGDPGIQGPAGNDGESATVTTFTDPVAFGAYVAGPLELAILTDA